MSKKLNFPSFNTLSERAEAFGCALQYVDNILLAVATMMPFPDWMRGISSVKYAPGYAADALDSDLVIYVKNQYLEASEKREVLLFLWLIDNEIDGWAYEVTTESFSTHHRFFFNNPDSYALARLAA